MNSKSANSKKVFGKYLSSLVIVLVLSVFVMPRTSHAFLSWDWINQHFNLINPDPNGPLQTFCNPTIAMFTNIAQDQPQQSIIRFGYNYDTVRYLKIFYNIFGVSPDNAIRCITTVPFTNVSALGAACTLITGAPASPDCGNFILSYNNDPNNPNTYALSSGGGSLISAYYALGSGVKNLGKSMDLNYFAYKSFEKTPFIGKALAQGSTNYEAPFVNEIYWAWQMVRNLAFGIFAILMLVVGIMMINRTRLSPQSVVTIQYALPKIIISIILIALSYPIGALFLTIVWYIGSALRNIMFVTGKNILLTQVNNGLGAYFSADVVINIGVFIVQILLSVFLTFGVGILALILVLILSLLIVVQFLLCLIKAAIYYLKMLFEVILAPVSFVYSAIPGNDDALMAWFKRMLAYSLSLIVLTTLPILVIYIALSISYALSVNSGAPTVGLGVIFSLTSGIVELVAGAFITYTGLSMTLKLPAQIEESITGKKKNK